MTRLQSVLFSDHVFFDARLAWLLSLAPHPRTASPLRQRDRRPQSPLPGAPAAPSRRLTYQHLSLAPFGGVPKLLFHWSRGPSGA